MTTALSAASSEAAFVPPKKRRILCIGGFEYNETKVLTDFVDKEVKVPLSMVEVARTAQALAESQSLQFAAVLAGPTLCCRPGAVHGTIELPAAAWMAIPQLWGQLHKGWHRYVCMKESTGDVQES